MPDNHRPSLGIEGGRSRGSTALLGAADAQIGVKKNGNGEVETVVDYMKDGSEGPELISRLEVINVGTDENGDPVTSCIVVPVEETRQAAPSGRRLSPNEKTMLSVLREAGSQGLTTDEWNELSLACVATVRRGFQNGGGAIHATPRDR